MGRTHKGTGFQNTQTSMSAALLTEVRAPSLRDMVYGYLQSASRPQSLSDVAAGLQLEECSVQPRLSELRDHGRIEDSGERGKTRFGRPCIMWRAVQKVQP